jgi:hypothetical protein
LIYKIIKEEKMRNNIIFVAVLFVLLFASECLAFSPAVIGGAREGLALGLMLDSGTSNKPALRLGFEATTGDKPGIFFIGGKWFLNYISGRYPMFVSGGLVAALGSKNSDVGPYISLIFEHFLDVKPLFLEVGIDAIDSGRLQLQCGYKF